MAVKDLAARIARIRLPQTKIAAATKLDEDTVSRALRARRGCLNSTAIKIEQVVVAEELRLRDHLIALHGIPENQGRAA